jgi:hypothetical protein
MAAAANMLVAHMDDPDLVTERSMYAGKLVRGGSTRI